jgi:nucleotide-binding universal stress UspA family protein
MSTPTSTATNNKSRQIFSKILVAIDGSEKSMDAADFAISIATMHNSELILNTCHTTGSKIRTRFRNIRRSTPKT